MADIYVLSLATTNDTFTPFFFHSFEKAQDYMLEWFDYFLREALDPYDHILGEDNHEEIEEIVTHTDHYNVSEYRDVCWLLSDNRFQILGDKEKNEVYVGHIDSIDNGTLIFADAN